MGKGARFRSAQLLHRRRWQRVRGKLAPETAPHRLGRVKGRPKSAPANGNFHSSSISSINSSRITHVLLTRDRGARPEVHADLIATVDTANAGRRPVIRRGMDIAVAAAIAAFYSFPSPSLIAPAISGASFTVDSQRPPPSSSGSGKDRGRNVFFLIGAVFEGKSYYQSGGRGKYIFLPSPFPSFLRRATGRLSYGQNLGACGGETGGGGGEI